MSFFTHKVVLITGSGSGIGKAVALDLASRGAQVILNGRNAAKLEAAAAELAALGYSAGICAGDVSQWQDCLRIEQYCRETYGRLDILINNAGIATRGSLEEMTPEVFRQVMDVNVLGSVYPTKALLGLLRAAQGHVIFISSLAGIHGLPYNSAYSASKSTLKAFSEAFRIENKAHRVHAGIAYVGFTENEPDKVFLDSDGRPIHIAPRTGVRKQSREQVASTLARMIEKRQEKVVLSAAGRGLAFLERFFPPLVAFIYTRNLGKLEEGARGEA